MSIAPFDSQNSLIYNPVMEVIRFDKETKEEAIERVVLKRNGKGFKVGGMIQTSQEKSFAMERIGLRRKIVIFEGGIGHFNIPLPSEKHNVSIPLV